MFILSVSRSTCRECLVCINIQEVRLAVMIEPDGESVARVPIQAWFHKKCFVQAVANYRASSSLLMPSNAAAFSLATLQASCFEGILNLAADEVKVMQFPPKFTHLVDTVRTQYNENLGIFFLLFSSL